MAGTMNRNTPNGPCCCVTAKDEIIRINFAVEEFGRQLRSSLGSLSGELAQMRLRKEKLEREIRISLRRLLRTGRRNTSLKELLNGRRRFRASPIAFSLRHQTQSRHESRI